MKLNKNSLLKINMSIGVDDALRAYTVLGRTNGISSVFETSLYSVLAEALGVDRHTNLYKIHELARDKVGTINYMSMQKQIENLFFGDKEIRDELSEKTAELEKLQDEIRNLKIKLGEA